ncbi:hypothetical protein [Aquimarina sp. 2201CG14-23]|uniref:hypothetical protein n=1 Tax=Aquimarina mycalae TaxID=3040073 RepID=UPI002477F256|nr:hypothetical protein [Aquimarina sp. 2201CG14-23]MDH7445736.1 hypothetical protein [Aquimarina sp. 2201CG14-23]
MKITTTIFLSFFFALGTYIITDADGNNNTQINTPTTQNDDIGNKGKKSAAFGKKAPLKIPTKK